MGLRAVEFNNNNKEWRSHKRGWQNSANTIQGRASKRKNISIPLQGLEPWTLPRQAGSLEGTSRYRGSRCQLRQSGFPIIEDRYCILGRCS